jgi:serine/threonine protein kinase
VRPEHDLVLGDRYVLNRPIATGGMGEVWEATDRLLSRPVAVKILKDELRSVPGFIERFRAEARHAGGLRHPGIATVFDYGETSEGAYLVMELVPGQPLSDLLVEQPQLPTEAKLSILAQTADALHAAHRAGVIHRDVKPANLIVGTDGAVKVTDFGIARAIGAAALTEAGQVIGTAHYMSPEQATGQPATSASDIYALGVIAYEMFVGRRPFDADTPLAVSMAHVHAAVPDLPADVPREVVELIRESLSKDPASRPPSAEAFAARARRAVREDRPAPTMRIPVAATVTSVQPSVPERDRVTRDISEHGEDRRPAATALLASVAVLLLIVSAVWLFASRADTDRSPETDSAGSDTAAATTEQPPTTTAAPEAAPATEPPVTAAPSTAPASTSLVTSTTDTVPATTTVAAPVATATPVTAAPTTNAPATATPAVMVGPQLAPIGGEEALAFVRTYYQQIDSGDYDTTWPSLTQEFRDARDLTFESYTRYWRNTSIELGELSFVPGPGPYEARVRFPARYTTTSGVAEEIDELTLQREQDGRVVIIEQRIVS